LSSFDEENANAACRVSRGVRVIQMDRTQSNLMKDAHARLGKLGIDSTSRAPERDLCLCLPGPDDLDRVGPTRPGPQPHNREVSGTLKEQMARVFGQRPDQLEQLLSLMLSDPERTRNALLQLLVNDITDIAAATAAEVRR
jgi:hypothetical protein